MQTFNLSVARRKALLAGKSIRLSKKDLHDTDNGVPLFATPVQHEAIATMRRTGKPISFRFESQDQGQYHIDHGKGLWSFIKNATTAVVNKVKDVLNGMPRQVKEFIERNGSNRITHLRLGRKPIHKGIELALNLLSQGEFGKVKSELSYDQIYHSYLLITLSNGETIKFEKNERVEFNSVGNDDLKQTYNVILPELGTPLTLRHFVNQGASSNAKEIYFYTSHKQNCQRFCYLMIHNNRLHMADETGRRALLPQDGQRLINSLGSKAGAANFITTFGAILNAVRHGGRVTYCPPSLHENAASGQ